MYLRKSYVRIGLLNLLEKAFLNLKVPTILVGPTNSDAEHAMRGAILRRRTLLIVGNCSVDYLGRARSRLDWGDRIVIAKTDGSFLVHRSSGYEPVNWMPKGNNIFSVLREEDVLRLRVTRQRPRESIEVSFARIHLIMASDLRDQADFSLDATEEDMQKAILLNPELLEKGVRSISWEKKVEPGFIDFFGTDKNGRLVVVEIKRKTAGKDAVLQLARYVEAIKQKADRQVRGILASPSVGRDVQRLLISQNLEYKNLDPKKCAQTLHRARTRKLSEYFDRTRT
jgi:RecB family endonuclease NucS